jgi:hypothetical protein
MSRDAYGRFILLGAVLGVGACNGGEPGEPVAESETGGDQTSTTDPATSTGADETGTGADETSTGGGETSTGEGETSTGEPVDVCGDGMVPTLAFEASFEVLEHGWARAERWSIVSPAIPEDPFFPDARSEQTGQQLEFFGGEPKPGPEQLVLQFGPGWDSHPGTPVVLVHGADDPPDRAWANPGLEGPYGCGDAVCPDTGLMQAIADAGHPVFAVTFPNKQGDNFMWVEQIHAAIQVVREHTCAEQVDLIGWSKGSFAARQYTSSVNEAWGTPYTDDVRKLILIGGPNLGFDYLFRYGSGNNSTVWPPGMGHGPTPHHEQIVGLATVDQSAHAVYDTGNGYYYRGQAQMLAAWIDTYGLSFVANSGLGPYAVVDSLSTYWGEAMYPGTFARGEGLAFAVAQHSLVDEIVAAGVPASISTYLLCSEISDQADYIIGIPNEISGPSDGVVFVDSCAAADGIGTVGEIAVLQDINHLELGFAEPAVQTVLAWLAE